MLGKQLAVRVSAKHFSVALYQALLLSLAHENPDLTLTDCTHCYMQRTINCQESRLSSGSGQI